MPHVKKVGENYYLMGRGNKPTLLSLEETKEAARTLLTPENAKKLIAALPKKKKKKA